MRPLEPSLAEVRAAGQRLAGFALRTPLVPLQDEGAPAAIHLKLENLQPVGSFKLRGAGNALLSASRGELEGGVYTASAGNMALALAYTARRLRLPCRVVVPRGASPAKVEAVQRLGAAAVEVPFDEWWRAMEEHRCPGLPGRMVHPFADAAVMAGNGTIGLELLEDLPDVDAVVVPYGGGGLTCGIAAAVKALRPDVRICAAEVETAAPVAASLAAGAPRAVEHRPSFVDGIGGKAMVAEMWPLVRELVDDAVVVTLPQIAEAIRLLARRSRVVAEGAAGAAVAAALSGAAGSGNVACIVSGGNIDAAALATILTGGVP